MGDRQQPKSIARQAARPAPAGSKTAAWDDEDDGETWYHGTPDERHWDKGGPYGFHVGSYEAARQALEATIGAPAEGDWDGTREYGKTPIVSNKKNMGYHTGLSYRDKGQPRHENARYGDGTPIPPDARPSIFPVRITGRMANSPEQPADDEYANNQVRRRSAPYGYYYSNVGEDSGSVSAALPSAKHVERIHPPKQAHTGSYGWDEDETYDLNHPEYQFDPPSASEEYWNPPHLYHGTSEELRPGDKVEGGHPSNFDKPKGTLPYGYATPHVSTAADYAETAARKRGGRPRVFEVDRAHDMMPDPEQGAAFGISSETYEHPDWRSKEGFRVLRELHPSEFGHHLTEDWPGMEEHTAALAPAAAAWHPDGSGSEHSGVYLRFGDWPHDERSFSPAGGYHEDGVSVYGLDRDGDPAIDWEGEHGNDPEEEMQGRVRKAERNRHWGDDKAGETGHLVRGEMTGIGYDGEPLLTNVRRVGDWIDHRHLFLDQAGPHRLAREPGDEGYEEPEEKPPYGYRSRTAAVEPQDDEDEDQDPDRYVTCNQGHEHWGAAGAAGLLVRHREGDSGPYRYLLQKRSPYVQHGSTWSTPGGALQHGETPEEGAAREAEEEGMRLPEGTTHHHTFTDDHGGWAYHTVVMDAPHQFSPSGEENWESEGHGWFTPQEAKKLPLHPGFAASWDKVRKSAAVEKPSSREEQLAAMDPRTRATALAQEQMRSYHPKTTLPLHERSGQSSHVLTSWLKEHGHPGAEDAYVAEHRNPGEMQSNTGRGPDGEPAVVLHPDRWDYGTLAHEAAHLITDHQTGRQFGEPHGPEGAHGPQWAKNYANLLNRVSKGAGGHFMSLYKQHSPKQEPVPGPPHREPQREAVPTAGLVYLSVPHGTLHALPQGMQPRQSTAEGEHHVTVAHLPRNMSDEEHAEVLRHAARAAAGSPPLEGHLGGMETFPRGAGAETRRVAFVPARVPGIERLHEDLAKVNVSPHHTFEPHVTVAYLRKGEDNPGEHPQVPVRFTHLHVERGGQVTSFPLTGDPMRREAAAAEPWHGMAASEPNRAAFTRALDVTRRAHPQVDAPVADHDATPVLHKMLGHGRFLYDEGQIEQHEAPPGPHTVATLAGHAAHLMTEHRIARGDDRGTHGTADERAHGGMFASHHALALGAVGRDVADTFRSAHREAEPEVANYRHSLGLNRDYSGSGLSPHMPPDLSHLPPMPESQQRAADEPSDRSRRMLLDVAKNPEPGTRIWRGERRGTGEDPASPGSVGIHWSVHPANVITNPYREDTSTRAVVWQARLHDPQAQAIPRSHPMWRGQHMSMDSEAEVRLHPHSAVHVEGAWVSDPGDVKGGVYPLRPEHNGPGWTWHPVGKDVEVRHAGHDIDYSDVGIRHEAAAEEEPKTYLHVSYERFPRGHMLTPQGKGWSNFDSSSGEHVYMTDSDDNAERYRYHLWEQGYPEQHKYEVRPTGPVEPDPDDPEAVRTRHPVEVTWAHDIDDEGNEESESDWFNHRTAAGYDLKPRSGMIYLDLPPGAVRPVPGGVDDHHITLVYLGAGVTDDAFGEACRRVQKAAARHAPMDGVLRGIDVFAPSKGSDGKVVAFVPAYVGGIGALRRELEDLSASEHTDYRPHCTLAYLKDGDSLPAPHPAVPLRFTHVHVKRGDEVVSFPLSGRGGASGRG